jgi:hypothetical protein
MLSDISEKKTTDSSQTIVLAGVTFVQPEGIRDILR